VAIRLARPRLRVNDFVESGFLPGLSHVAAGRSVCAACAAPVQSAARDLREAAIVDKFLEEVLGGYFRAVFWRPPALALASGGGGASTNCRRLQKAMARCKGGLPAIIHVFGTLPALMRLLAAAVPTRLRHSVTEPVLSEAEGSLRHSAATQAYASAVPIASSLRALRGRRRVWPWPGRRRCR